MRYRRPSRLRRIAKWVGLGMCVGITGIWLVTFVFTVSYWYSYDVDFEDEVLGRYCHAR